MDHVWARTLNFFVLRTPNKVVFQRYPKCFDWLGRSTKKVVRHPLPTAHEFALICHFFYKNISFLYIWKKSVLAGKNLEPVVHGLCCKINSSRLVDHQKLLSWYLIGKSRTCVPSHYNFKYILHAQISRQMCLETHFQYEFLILGRFGQSGLQRKKQARKGFRPISASQNFLGIFWEFFWNFFWNFSGIVWEFLGKFLGILLEFFGYFLGILLKLFRNCLGLFGDIGLCGWVGECCELTPF